MQLVATGTKREKQGKEKTAARSNGADLAGRGRVGAAGGAADAVGVEKRPSAVRCGACVRVAEAVCR